MRQTKKGNQWQFGMKAHIEGGGDSQLVHTVVVTAANVADVIKTRDLLHGEDKQGHADAVCAGVEKREEIVASDRKFDWQIAAQCGTIKAMAEGAEKAIASARLFVEHPFHMVKNLFRHRNVRYRGAGQERASTLPTLWIGQRGDRRANRPGLTNHCENRWLVAKATVTNVGLSRLCLQATP